MDERIMKVLEAAGARIADLEADLAEYKDANTYVCGQRDALQEELDGIKEEIERLNRSVKFESEAKMFWFREYEKEKSRADAL